MFKGLEEYDGDTMAISMFSERILSRSSKLLVFLHSFISPRRNDGWNVKIKRNVSYSYNIDPNSVFLRTESAPFAICLCKKSAYHAIHFEDERWLDKMGYAAGDDQLFFYKMHLMGFRVLQYMNSGVIHLDAQSGHRKSNKNKMFLQKKNMFIMWYRTIFNIRSKGFFEKCRCVTAFSWRCLFGVFTLPLEVIHYRQSRFFIDYFRGLWAGYRYVCSEEYRQIPSFDAYKKE